MKESQAGMHDRGNGDRVVEIIGPVDQDMQAIRRELRRLAHIDQFEPIHLVINSAGGSVLGAAAVLDVIEWVQSGPTDVHGWVEGIVGSAALSILQGCHHRVAGSFSVFMAHGISCSEDGDEIDRAAKSDFSRILADRMAQLYGERTAPLGGRSVAAWRRLFKSDRPHYFTPAQAIAEGLVDEIVG